MASINERQQAVAQDLVQELVAATSGRGAVWNLAGTVGSGKTSVLRLVRRALAVRTDVVPVMMSPPAGDVDTASIALIDAAIQLEAKGLLTGHMSDLSEPSLRWDAKMAIVTAALEAHADRVIILCDEPTRWYNNRESAMDDAPDYHARNFAEWIVGHARCRGLVAGWIPNDVPHERQKYAPYLDDAHPFLAEASEWRETAPLARSLEQALPRSPLRQSLWEAKLLVALSRVKSAREVAAQAARGIEGQALLEELLCQLEGRQEHRPICESLARLSLARTPVDRQTFDALTAASPRRTASSSRRACARRTRGASCSTRSCGTRLWSAP